MTGFEVYSTGSKWAYKILATGECKNGFPTHDAAEAAAKALVLVSEPEKPSKRGKKEVEAPVVEPDPVAQLPMVGEALAPVAEVPAEDED